MRHWAIRPAGNNIEWTDTDTAATVIVRGTATELFLLTLRRIPIDHAGIEIAGDRALLQQWLTATVF